MRLRLAAVLSCLPMLASAAPVVYVCNIDTSRSTGAFQPQIVIAHDAAERVVSVNDPLIQGINGGPLLGEMATENDTRIVFTWTLRNVPTQTGQTASLLYRATIFKADGDVQLSMKPLNFDNNFSARGNCQTE
jgi:activator of HSP90 ATPase